MVLFDFVNFLHQLGPKESLNSQSIEPSEQATPKEEGGSFRS